MVDVLINTYHSRFRLGRKNNNEELDFSVLRANHEKELASESLPWTPKSRLNKIAEKAGVVSLILKS